MPSPAPKTQTKVFAPGARVVIRDEEWIVRSVHPATYGGAAVRVTGLSELVRGKDAIFLSELDEIQELRPEETDLVPDSSPQYRKARLYLESLLRRTPPTDNYLHIGHRGAIRQANFQLQPAAKALRQTRPRILMADGVGLGKTIEAGVLISELIRRGRGDRILVVALKSILAQLQEELWARFTIPLVRLDSIGIQRIQSRIPSNMNPFYFFDRVIISIDTLKKDEKYRRYLEDSRWDVILVDECQNVALRTREGSTKKSQRARLAQLLSRTTDALIFTSATPHDGRAESFASLMNLLEPTAVADPKNYTSEEVKDLFLRRFKKDIAHEVEGCFQERTLHLLQEKASAEEDAVFERLSQASFKTIARQRQGKGVLFRTLLLKAFLSSPAAASVTIKNRLGQKALEDGKDERVGHDRAVLDDLLDLVDAVRPKKFRKYQKLLSLLRDQGFDKKENTNRIVIFSERIPTLDFLSKRLQKDLDLEKGQIAVFHGTLDDKSQMDLVKSFGTESSPIRILLASDAASEGVNLHFYCHLMVHFDLPWSLITLEQRNGRIDRFGQNFPPEISYLLTIPSNKKIQGDLRVLQRLIEKEQEAHKNLGDAAWLMGLYDSELEEEQIGKGIEEGKDPNEVIPDKPKHTDLMDILFGDNLPTEPPAETADPYGLYPNDLEYAREAFAEILGKNSESVEWHDHLAGFTLHPPDDLQKRYEFLPGELRRNGSAIKLTTDRERVMESLEKSREEEDHWPEWELFWEHHPVALWLNDHVLASFDRHEAPILRVPEGVASGERVLLFQGVISNKRSQPVLVDWFGVVCRQGKPLRTLPFGEILQATRLREKGANPGKPPESSLLEELRSLLGPAVGAAREHMRDLRRTRSVHLGAEIRDRHRAVVRWRDGKQTIRNRQRELILGSGRNVRRDEERRFEEEKQYADRVCEERKVYIENTLMTVEEPYLRVVAVLIPQEA